MGSRSQRRRRSRPATRTGRVRADTVAARLGVGLREARRDAHRTQAEVGHAAGVSQTLVSALERGHGAGATIETWACLAAAVGEQFVGFLERAPGADRPRDMEHLRRQSALIELASAGGWSALPELAVDPGLTRGRSIDVALVRRATREAVVVEVWDWFDDVGAGLRSLDAKCAALATRFAGGSSDPTRWHVRGLYVVRGTRRNRRLVDELRPLFAARFPASSISWLRTLAEPTHAMPASDGLLWTNRGGALAASRLGRHGPLRAAGAAGAPGKQPACRSRSC